MRLLNVIAKENSGVAQLDVVVNQMIYYAGITNAAQLDALQYLVSKLKKENLWSKFYDIRPYVGGTAFTHGFNLINVKGGVNHVLNFYGGWSHTSLGIVGNGTNSYAVANLPFNYNGTNKTGALLVYSQTNSSGGIELGQFNGGDTPFGISLGTWFTTNGITGTIGNNSTYNKHRSPVINNDGRGFAMVTRRGGNSVFYYRKTPLFDELFSESDTGFSGNHSRVISIGSLFEGGSWTIGGGGGSPSNYSNKTISFTALSTESFSSSEMKTLEQIVNNFQIMLGRNVY